MIVMKELHTIEEWQDVLAKSKDEPILLLKHSTTCPISTSAFNRVENFETDLPKYWLKVRETRPVSNEIESTLGVEHQSPQLFILNKGEAVWNASHTVITDNEINRGLKENSID
jgi:bacillithiol system protein YtxJ